MVEDFSALACFPTRKKEHESRKHPEIDFSSAVHTLAGFVLMRQQRTQQIGKGKAKTTENSENG